MESILLHVKQPQDDHFLFELYQLNRQQEVSLWGWSEQQLGAFLTMQYQMQLHSYERQYPQAECLVVYWGDKPIGRFLVAREDKEWVIVDIAIVPEYHNQGIGSFILKQFLEEASREEKTVRLSVLNGNRAKQLYERLGFTVFREDEVYSAMRVG